METLEYKVYQKIDGVLKLRAAFDDEESAKAYAKTLRGWLKFVEVDGSIGLVG